MVDNVRYKFESRGLSPGDRLDVVDFKGVEGISRPYEFTITLKSENPDIDFDDMLRARCVLKVDLGDKSTRFHGVLKNFDQLQQVGQFTLYRAVLVPRFWQLSLYRTNEVYLDQTVPDMIEQVLEECGFTTLDYELRLAEDYDEWEYRCEYDETHFDFLSRIMERDGIYYFFEQDEDSEKVIFCDRKYKQRAIAHPEISFAPATGLDLFRGDVIHSLVCNNQRMPQQIVLKDFNYEKPTLDVVGVATIDERGLGEVYSYGDNIQTPEDGVRLAEIRAEEIYCTKSRFHGEGIAVGLMSGYQFTLKSHFRSSFNQDYLIVGIRHEGRDPSFLTREANTQDEPIAGYYNSFEAIPAEVQFRPPRIATKQRIRGTIHATIDAEGDGQYAELDDEGRYKVLLPFDRVRRQEGKASHRVRMASPFAGANEGMHFPLRKGAEVLLSFIDGDPDRPVIASAIANGANPNVVSGENQTKNVIKTSGGSLFEIEDSDDSQRVKLYSPTNDTYLHLGAPNHDGDGYTMLTTGLYRREALGGGLMTLVTKNNVSGITTNPAISTNTKYSSGDRVQYNSSEWVAGNTVSTIANTTQYSAGDYAVATSGTLLKCLTSPTAWASGTSYASGQAVWSNGGYWLRNDTTGANTADEPSTATTYWDQMSVDEVTATYFVAGSDSDVIDAYGFSQSTTDAYDERALYKFKTKSTTGAGSSEMSSSSELSGNYLIYRRKGDIYQWTDGNDYNFGGGREFSFGNGYEVAAPLDTSDPSTVISYLSSDSRRPRKVKKVDQSDPTNSNRTDTEIDTLSAWTTFVDSEALTEFKWQDSVEVSFGNSYSFGTCYEYSFGSGYSETHKDENAEINKKQDYDKQSSPRSGNASGEHVTINASTDLIDKTIANQYEYFKGNKLSVETGTNKEEHDYYDNAYEYGYGGLSHSKMYYSSDANQLCSEEKTNISSGNITEEEWKWRPSGSLVSYERKADHGGGTFEFHFEPKMRMAIDLSLLDMNIEMDAIQKTTLHTRGLEMDINLLGMGMEVSTPAWSTIEIAPGKVEIKVPFADINVESADLTTALTEVDNKLTVIENETLELKNAATKLGTAGVRLLSGGLSLFA